jgi:lysophospholipase L1-like esterase
MLRTFWLAALVLFALEVCARLDDYVTFGASPLGPYNQESLYEVDDLGKRGKPFGRFEKWRLNSLGFRGPELNSARMRVVAIGASETFGLYEKEGGEFPRRLEEELNKGSSGKDVEVVNVAYPGLRIRTFLKRFPEIVKKARPSFGILYPSPAHYIERQSVAPTRAQAAAVWSFGTADCRVCGKARNVVKGVLPQWLRHGLIEIQVNIQAARLERVLDRVPEGHIEDCREDLREFVRAMREADVEPVLATHATRFGSRLGANARAWLVAWRKFYPSLAGEGFLDLEARVNDTIRDVAREEQVLLVDIAAEMPTGSEYFADYVHFTDKGSQVVAELIAARLLPHVREAASGRDMSTVFMAGHDD